MFPFSSAENRGAVKLGIRLPSRICFSAGRINTRQQEGSNSLSFVASSTLMRCQWIGTCSKFRERKQNFLTIEANPHPARIPRLYRTRVVVKSGLKWYRIISCVPMQQSYYNVLTVTTETSRVSRITRAQETSLATYACSVWPTDVGWKC